MNSPGSAVSVLVACCRISMKSFPPLGSSGNPPLRLLWVACGKDDVWTNLNRDFNQWLNSKSIQHTYTETPGRHTWLVWRQNLADFAPLLFR